METYQKPVSKDPQVFISFRGHELRKTFIYHLVRALKRNGVNVYMDVDEKRFQSLLNLFQRINDYRIALVIFSKRYAESSWCLDELVKIKEREEEGKLVSLPIFYKLNPTEVKGLEGDFGSNLWNHVKETSTFDKLKIWKEALDFVSQKPGLISTDNSDEGEFITSIIEKIKDLSWIMEKQRGDRFSSSGELKLVVDSESDAFQWNANQENAESFQGEAKVYSKSRKDDAGLNRRNDDGIFLGKTNSDAVPDLQNSVERKNEKRAQMYQVFINFHGKDTGFSFVSHLASALSMEGANILADEEERRESISECFKKIEDSHIALVVFSSMYSESTWCLNELVKIKECMDEGRLKVIPIFYKVEPSQVQQLNGAFGDKLWNLWRLDRDHHIINWMEALEFVASVEPMMRFWPKDGYESVFVTSIVEEVNKDLPKISSQEEQSPELSVRRGGKPQTFPNKDPFFGMERRLDQLEKRLQFDYHKTRIIGVVGMPGIGKTTLAMMLYRKWNCKFVRCVPLLDIREKSKDYGLVWLRTALLKVLLGGEISIINDETTHKSVKSELLQTKVFIVLDDVCEKKQIEFLLGDLKWIKKGSKIVITTCDKSLLEGLAHDTYLVPPMDYKEAFQLFSYHARDNQIPCPPGTLMDNAGGNPLALKLMGSKLGHLEHKLQTHSSIMNIPHVLKFYIDQLNEQQKDVFLDIVCFFKLLDEYFVRSILDSGDPNSTDAVSPLRDLANKFLITISDGRVEVNDLVYMFGKDLSSPWLRLWKYKNIIKKLKETEKSDVRGMFLDISKARNSIYLEPSTFTNMSSLRYLNIYDSGCPRQCKADCKLNFPHGLQFPLEEVRYLHWENFPLEELPSDFLPNNLVDLTLPYSKIKRVWEGLKYTPKLKWVDLRHSRKLLNVSGFSTVENIERLNLEGCTTLDNLPSEVQNMRSLVFLNLRGCISLRSFPKVNLTSLKILILSYCSSLKEFQLISESLEFLHLDGTAINTLHPYTIKKFRRLVLLNLRNCKLLDHLPSCLSKLKNLEELILSGCSQLKVLPDVKHSMKHIQILHLDRTGATEMPNISSFTESEPGSCYDPTEWPQGFNEVSALGRLCLSGNDFVKLQDDISRLYNLKWLDLKHCKKLKNIPILPPRLQYFDAHGCDSLERVSNPLALQVMSENTHVTFIFSNCKLLALDAIDSIITYTRRRSQLVLDALSRYDGGIVFQLLLRTCFPGWNVPAWFSYISFGPVLDQKLLPHWCDNRFTGIALCAVILFNENHDQMNHLLVKCICMFKNEDEEGIHFTFTVGGWREAPKKIESSHVFIGYMSKMVINKHGVGNNAQGCMCTQASFQFQVTDGTREIVGCEVLECGFSLVLASDITEDETSFANSRKVDDDLRCESYSGLTLQSGGTKSGGVPDSQKSFGNKTFGFLNDENNTSSEDVEKPRMLSFVGVELRLKQLEKVLYSTPGKTRIIGVVGEPGVGKTTLATILFEKRGRKFPSNVFFRILKEHGLERLRTMFLEELLKDINQTIRQETTHEHMKEKLSQAKSFIVLDDVSDKKQLDFLLGNLNWIKKGSKIVITTRDMSFLEGFVHDTYEVPKLNSQEAFQLLSSHAVDDQMSSPARTFLTLSRRKLLDDTESNPSALILSRTTLSGKDLSQWHNKMQTMTGSDKRIQDSESSSTDQLRQQHKDVFLNIVPFFRSEDECNVRSLLDLDSAGVICEAKDLADKFSEDRVEIDDVLYALCKDLGSPGQYRLLNDEDITVKLQNMGKVDANDVRGIFIDLSDVTKRIALERTTFINMCNLRFLKIYNSSCPRQCEADCRLYFPEGLRFPLREVRYLHWLKFPLGELPSDFLPNNLIDLSLPYSKIERVWDGVKETSHLKCVDLSYSVKLFDISALSKAENLQRLNLEGCTNLEELPMDIQNMESLVFLNLRGCIGLLSIPEMNLISLKTLILTNCSRLKKFHLMSTSVEFLHLEGTSITELPPAVKKLQRLVLLNMRNCKKLEMLPDCLSELKLLEELIVSGCSMLKNFPYIKQSMKHLQVLLFDETGAEEMPKISYFTRSKNQATADTFIQQIWPSSNLPLGVNKVSLLQRLCLSGNDFLSLETDIVQLSHLTWLDVKNCKKLTSIPMLPPRLQFFDARGCDSLEKVSNPLALPVATEQIQATFNFSNCNKLDHNARDSIISYTRQKIQLVLYALSRYNGGVGSEASMGTCFPGCDVPTWFKHRSSGSFIMRKLPPHWFDNRFTGIALCSVIQFSEYKDHGNFSVQCTCMFKSEDGLGIPISYTVGVWSKSSSTLQNESSHVLIGYVFRLDIHKQEERCTLNETSFEFQVTDGTGKVVVGCKVLKCGFDLVYAPDERENLCWDARRVATTNKFANFTGEAPKSPKLLERSQSHSDIQHQPYPPLAETQSSRSLRRNIMSYISLPIVSIQ